MPFPERGLSQLRKGRIAVPGARYFVTAVTRERRTGLATWAVWAKLLELAAREPADVWALVLMPDHWHGLFVLPENAAPGDFMRALKGPLSPVLREAGLGWQRDYHEHRLRAEDASEPYLRYMMANPYRAGLLEIGERWPFWAITSPNVAWFVKQHPEQMPEPEWLALDKPWLPEDQTEA